MQSWEWRHSKQALSRIRESVVLFMKPSEIPISPSKTNSLSELFLEILTAEQKLFASVNNANTSQLCLNHISEKSNLTPPKQNCFAAEFATDNDLTGSLHLNNQSTEAAPVFMNQTAS